MTTDDSSDSDESDSPNINLGGSDESTDSSTDSEEQSYDASEFPGFDSSDSSGGDGGSGGGGGHTSYSDRWNTKLDFGKAYVIVAEDQAGRLYVHHDTVAILDSNLDWRRLQEHPNKDFEIIYRCISPQTWHYLCELSKDQLGVDPVDVLQEEPRTLAELRDRISFPNPSKPDHSVTCDVCGVSQRAKDTELKKLDLQVDGRVTVCTTHSIQELMDEDLID